MANMDGSIMGKREPSPFKYPGAANIGLSTPSSASFATSGAPSIDGTSNNAFNSTTFAAQASLSNFEEPSFAQDLDHTRQQQQQHQQQQLQPQPQSFGIDTSDPAFDAFQSSAQHFNLDSSFAPGLNTTGDSFNTTNNAASILDTHISPQSLSNEASPDPITTFPTFDFNPASLDPTLLNDLDLLQEQSQQDTLLDTTTSNTSSFDPMSAALGSHSPTPPHLLQSMMRNSASPGSSPHASPNVSQASFAAISRPRNVSDSLDPSSAAYLQGHGGSEWGNMNSFRGHRRVASDNLSEISSHSNQASPYLGVLDDMNVANQSSPLLNPVLDPSFNDSLGIDGFTISEHASSRPPSYHSPAHSPHVSPRLPPQQQQPLPAFTAENNYGLNDASAVHGQFNQTNGFDLYNTNQEPFPSLQQGLSPSSAEMGQADHLSPPAIHIDHAEPTRPLNVPPTTTNTADLNIPARRSRAKSDSYADARPSSPGFVRGRSPSLQPGAGSDSLSPFQDGGHGSRSTSPRGRNGSLGHHVRSTSSASDQREYILELANPERSPSNSGESRRSQKHPATFQCTLCPKRFTRAYNLRSHLRTHTDERPFVCTVCKKAFARQHDRKRHEGLHSGEKKFVCRGSLKSGGQWGCSRRFARADALGRHFRSEAGRVCIKPLLDEEAAEQEQAWRYEQQQAQAVAGFVPQQMNMPTSFFPQALLQQYPALAGIDWSSAPANQQDEEYNGGRSSYDASSGGEMYEDLSENELSNPYGNQNVGGINMGGMDQGFGMDMQQQQQQQQQQAQMHGYGNHQMADFTNGMEGR